MTRPKTALLLLPLLAGAPAACLAPAPSSHVESLSGTVRAESVDEAQRVSGLLEQLQPALRALLPGSRPVADLEVWIQDQPRLYALPGSASHDAEGLWSESHSRILLARDADHLERTLAHELVHAHLGDDWATLPGTLEEGLCDHLSACLAPEGAPRLRAGRLSSAALACGGIQLELALETPAGEEWSARVALSGARLEEHPQRGVFRLSAGLSSTRLEPSAKRGYYGLAFLLIERVVERRGLPGLFALCRRAERLDYDHVPRPWLLEAAGLEDTPEAWQQAALQAMGAPELAELVDMHPRFAVDALADYLAASDLPGTPAQQLDALAGELRLVGSDATIDVTTHPTVRAAVLRRLAADQ